MNKGFNFSILQESGKLPNLTDRLHSSLIGFDRSREPSFRKRPERSSIPVALRTFVILKIFSVSISVLYVKRKASVCIKSIFGGRCSEFFQKIVSYSRVVIFKDV